MPWPTPATRVTRATGRHELVPRPVRPEEHESVADLTARVYLGGGFSSPSYEPELRDVAGRASEATVLVEERDGGVVGAVTVATAGGPWAEQSVPGEAVVRMLAVDPAERGAGIGESLVRACVDRARQAGCSAVRLSSQDDMTAAHRLYERLGFVRTPSHDWSPIPGLRLRAYALLLAPWCGWCGQELTEQGHTSCRRTVELDPPRFCAHCRRRMVVQVTPTSWTARCSEHPQIGG